MKSLKNVKIYDATSLSQFDIAHLVSQENERIFNNLAAHANGYIKQAVDENASGSIYDIKFAKQLVRKANDIIKFLQTNEFIDQTEWDSSYEMYCYPTSIEKLFETIDTVRQQNPELVKSIKIKLEEYR
jgi:hypothetical protein